MKPKELNNLLLEKIPNIKSIFDEETSWQEGIDTGSFVVFEDIFMPYIIHCVEQGKTEEIEKCFSFIEECVTSNDLYQKNVIEVSIIENFHSYDISNKLAGFLKKESAKEFYK